MLPRTVTVGPNAAGGTSSQLVRFDNWAPGSTVTIQIDVTGTVNYTVQTTLDDPNSPQSPVPLANVTWFNAGDSAIVGATAAAQSSLAVLPVFAKVVMNSGTGTVKATFLQVGNVAR